MDQDSGDDIPVPTELGSTGELKTEAVGADEQHSTGHSKRVKMDIPILDTPRRSESSSLDSSVSISPNHASLIDKM